MYWIMDCPSPDDGDHALLEYKPDGQFRTWMSGAIFGIPPPEPVIATVMPGYSGIMAELWQAPVPLMTERLLAILRRAGVDNLDTYRAEVRDAATKEARRDYVAFNVIGLVTAADLGRAVFDTGQPDRKISMIFDALAIDNTAAMHLLLFRLGEAVNALVVHDRVKQAVEDAGLTMIEFFAPEEWAG
ncbi:hypothetical protein ACSRUE_01880 [Sorangium sp. KYC3313]|uniref:hypothetical protein n=1 Tax=Sorangium sp. KYC3313 TaxID=3449740 RepID=UPI003F8B6779